MPRSPAQPMPKSLAPHVRAAFEKIDREADAWFLPNWRVSILGDAKIYAENPRIRDSALAAIGVMSRDHAVVREHLRGRLQSLWWDRKDAAAFRRFASMLVGERRLAREVKIARRFAPAEAA